MSQTDSNRYQVVDHDQSPLAYRLRAETDAQSPQVLMLHGLSGDENSMWALESARPAGSLLIAPRAPFEQRQGGYAWLPVLKSWPPLVEEFGEAVERLEDLLDSLESVLDRDRLVLMGFSNGAAMSLASAMTPMSTQAAGIIVAAGHLPQGEIDPLREIPIFWGHGTRDSFIPIEIARQDVDRLRQLGTQITYCETDVGHKLGLECMRGLGEWFHENFAHLKEVSS